ncbi:MAG TPA: cytochrome P450, partial [Trebonia sp.]
MTEPAAPPAEQLGEDYFQHPLAYFGRMREEGPVTPVVLPHSAGRIWLVTRYADVRAALADPRLHKDWASKLTEPGWKPDEMTAYLNMHLLNADPPDHTRLRKLVSRAFTARRVAGLRPRIGAVTTVLLDAMAARLASGESVDLIDAFAFPLPVTVICELLGIPAGDQAEFRDWSHAILSDAGDPGSFYAAGSAMFQYFMKLVAAKRAQPADDLVSAL